MQHDSTIDRTNRFGRRPPGKYATLVLGDETTLVYDVEDPTGWVQSDIAVSLIGMR